MAFNSAPYQCYAWPILSEDEEDMDRLLKEEEEEELFIEIYSQIREDGSESIYKRFEVKRKHLLDTTTNWSTIQLMLIAMDIPFPVHPLVSLEISRCAQEIITGRKATSIVVQVTATTTTTKSGFDEVLEKVKFVDDGENSQKHCVICWEDFCIGMDVTRIPCSHVYHANCIRNWLQRSNACPLCRFQIPN